MDLYEVVDMLQAWVDCHCRVHAGTTFRCDYKCENCQLRSRAGSTAERMAAISVLVEYVKTYVLYDYT